MKHRAQERDDDEAALPDLPRSRHDRRRRRHHGRRLRSTRPSTGSTGATTSSGRPRRRRTVEPFFAALAGDRDSVRPRALRLAHRSPEEVARRVSRLHGRRRPAPPAASGGRPRCCRRSPSAATAPSAACCSSTRSTRWRRAGARTPRGRSSCGAARTCSRSARSRTGRSATAPRSRRCGAEIAEVTQCVFALSEGRLRIAKAEARGPGVEGSVFRMRVEDGRPVLEAAPAAARLGTALRAVRTQRNLSQSDLARLLGISPSAVSQAERGRRGLSLETLLDACTKLDLTLDELLRGDVQPRLPPRPPPRPAAARRRPSACADRRPPGRAARVPADARAAPAGDAAPRPQGRRARRGGRRPRAGAARQRAARAAPRGDAARRTQRGARMAQPRRERRDALLDSPRRPRLSLRAAGTVRGRT